MADNLIGFTTFYSETSKRREKDVTLEDDPKAKNEISILILIPAGIVEWVAAAPCTAWEIQVKITSLIVGTEGDTIPPSPHNSMPLVYAHSTDKMKGC